MKILHILNTRTFSGAENVACQIIETFKGDNKFEMAYCSPDGEIRDVLREKNILFLPVKKLTFHQLRSVIREFNPDVIHAHDFRAASISSLFCGHRKLVIHIHQNHPQASRISARSLLLLFASFVSRMIFWVSQDAFDHFIFNEIVKKKSTVLLNIINVDNVIKLANENSEKGYDIVYLGRLSQEKNPIRFIKIIDLVRKKRNVSCAMIGDGILRTKCENLIKELELDDTICILGYKKNPYPVLKKSRILLMTSNTEGIPMSVLESFAFGIPVISTPAGGVPEVVTNWNGFISSSNEEIVEEIVRLLGNNAAYLAKSAECILDSQNRNDIKKYRDNLIEAYLK